MNNLKRKVVASGLGLGLLAGGAAGAVLGSSGVSGAQETATTQAPAAADAAPESRERPSGEEMQDQRKERLADTLAPLVEAGTIDQAQADAVIETLLAAPTGDGRGGRGGPGHRGGPGGVGLDTAAEALGIEADELRDALANGSTLAQVAESKGIERQALIDSLVTAAKERILVKLSEGKLTQEQADERLAQVDARVAEQVDRAGTDRGRGGSAPDRAGGSHGGGDDSSGTAPTPEGEPGD